MGLGAMLQAVDGEMGRAETDSRRVDSTCGEQGDRRRRADGAHSERGEEFMSGGQERRDASISRPDKAKETRQGKVRSHEPRQTICCMRKERGRKKKEGRREVGDSPL